MTPHPVRAASCRHARSRHERLYLENIDGIDELDAHAGDYWQERNHVRPEQVLSWRRPIDGHLGIAGPAEPSNGISRTLPTT
jgi:hypothetical protein